MRRRLLRLGWVVVLSATLASATTAQAGSGSPGYRIGPRDVVRVDVVEDNSLNLERARVNENGTIELLHVGPVTVGGMTEIEARAAIEESLGRYLQRATVKLEILEFRSKPITILGGVLKPGPLDVSGRWTLLEAIMEAGGPGPNAGKTVLITRRAPNGLSDQLTVDLQTLMEGLDPLVNIPLYANDLVTVAIARDVTVFCIGELTAAGAITFSNSERATLLAAIARAGGLTDRAANKILVRRTETGEEITVSWKKLLAGRTADVVLYPGDFVIVKESFF
ncbi:MAG: polysaccharide biosynthesis/export family protein [Thermoanaerobaculia bacterium]